MTADDPRPAGEALKMAALLLDISHIFGDYGMQGTHLHDRVLAQVESQFRPAASGRQGGGAVSATVFEDDETEALDLVYAWLGGDRAARTLLTRPEYDALVANIAQALADRSAGLRALAALRAAEELRAAADWLSGDSDGPAAPEWPNALPRADVAAMLRDRADGPACMDCGSPYHGRPCPRAAERAQS